MKPNQAKQVLSELIPIYSEQQTLGRGSGRPVTVAEFNGVWREEDLKDASLLLIAPCPDGTLPLAPAIQSLLLHPGVNICPKNHYGNQIFFISAAATIRSFWPNFK